MDLIRVDVNHGIADLILQRPKVNAMNLELFDQFTSAFQRAARDPAIQGVLLRSEGRCFSAGLDLNEVLGLGSDGITAFLDALDKAIGAGFYCNKPVAAAVAGHALAGGLVLALSADFVALQQGSYSLGLTELQVGVPFPRLAFEIVRDAIGPRALRRLVYTADRLTPQEAFELGIGDVLTDEAETAARHWLQKVTANPSATFAIAKRQIRQDAYHRIETAHHAKERAELIETIFSDEVAQAAMKILMKRS